MISVYNSPKICFRYVFTRQQVIIHESTSNVFQVLFGEDTLRLHNGILNISAGTSLSFAFGNEEVM